MRVVIRLRGRARRNLASGMILMNVKSGWATHEASGVVGHRAALVVFDGTQALLPGTNASRKSWEFPVGCVNTCVSDETHTQANQKAATEGSGVPSASMTEALRDFLIEPYRDAPAADLIADGRAGLLEFLKMVGFGDSVDLHPTTHSLGW